MKPQNANVERLRLSVYVLKISWNIHLTLNKHITYSSARPGTCTIVTYVALQTRSAAHVLTCDAYIIFYVLYMPPLVLAKYRANKLNVRQQHADDWHVVCNMQLNCNCSRPVALCVVVGCRLYIYALVACIHQHTHTGI